MNRIILYSPPFYKDGCCYSGVLDTELIYLGQYLFNGGYETILIDSFYDENNEALLNSLNDDPNDLLLIHLWKTELCTDNRLNKLINSIGAIHLKYPKLCIGCFGSIAYSFKEVLLSVIYIQIILSQKSILISKGASISTIILQSLEFIQGYFVNLPMSWSKKTGQKNKITNFLSYEKHTSKI